MYINGEPLNLLISIKKISLADLANATNVSVKTLKNIIHGHANPTYSTLVLLADFFDVPLDFICSRNIDRYYVKENDEQNVQIVYYDANNHQRIIKLLRYLQLSEEYRE